MNALFRYVSCFYLIFYITPFLQAQDIKIGSTRAIEGLNPTCWIYHKNSQVSELYFKTTSRELVYNRRESADFTALLQINYKVWAVDNLKQVVDTGTISIVDLNNEQKLKEINGTIELRLPEGKNYKLKIDFADKKRNFSQSSIFYIYKKDRSNRQNFLIKNSNGKVLNSPYIFGESVVVHSRLNVGMTLQVRVYNREFPLAAPPFAEGKVQQYKYEADSIYYVTLKDSGFVNLKLPKTGFIHLVPDTSKKEGLTLFSSSKYFPRIAEAIDLIEPLRFLCTSDEFKRIKSSENMKLAIDRFWLDKSGTHDLARALIRGYYSRAEYANKNFSSYTSGWKTDRGMVHLIFGEPTAIDRTDDSETWIYGDRFSTTALRFNFIKTENPFTGNDYYLQRLVNYKPEWYRAVDSWRLGKIYKYVN